MALSMMTLIVTIAPVVMVIAVVIIHRVMGAVVGATPVLMVMIV
jgi:hypothetical protein